MPVTRETILTAISDIALPQGGTLGQADLIRALTIDQETVRFVLEVENAATAQAMAPVEAEARARLERIPGVAKVQIVMTAPAKPAPPKAVSGQGAAPSLKIGGHPTPQAGPQAIPGVRHIIAVGSGKGGVGKSTVTSNLAVALARAGRKVGLLDADIYGPSQPRMMGVSGRPASPDGQRIDPMHAHGVTVMSIGLMLKEGEALVWRGPMLMGALQQLLQQVNWGELDVLLIDLPPGTGDVQLTMLQRHKPAGAVIVSTPQDLALIDAKRAIQLFEVGQVPVIGMVENMAGYACPHCGEVSDPFGSGGAETAAAELGMPFLGRIPLQLAIREASDAGTPPAAGEGPAAEAFAALARRVATWLDNQ